MNSMNSSSNELRVFISSTFRDMQEEREHLVKKIFPEIRALCRERGITFTDVDLRWGLKTKRQHSAARSTRVSKKGTQGDAATLFDVGVAFPCRGTTIGRESR